MSEDKSSGIDRRSLFAAAAASAVLAAPGAVAATETGAWKKVGKGTWTTARDRATPESAARALLPDRLQRLDDILARHVASKRFPGLVGLVSRRGETHVTALGTLAFDNKRPMVRDTIFRIASITKPITAVAAMILVEECLLRLDDPVDLFLPELANRKVLRAVDAPLDDTVPAKRSITLRDLLTFRFGHGAVMVYPEQYPIQTAMNAAGIAPGASLPALPADELMQRYGSLPLIHQPGEGWLYNSGADVLGVLIARAAGMPLGAFLAERIFAPLGMADTAFSVPPESTARLADAYQTDFTTGEVALFDKAEGGRFASPPIFESGAGGLVSTVDDYLRFARMMLGKGEAEGVRILSRPSVELMTANVLSEAERRDPNAAAILGADRGWGLGLAVQVNASDIAGTPGRFGWDGGYGTSAWMDPSENLVGILMTQRVWDSPIPPAVLTDFWTATYAAIAD
jgi:CubicO group peptidase (beta-lactamase class C family)